MKEGIPQIVSMYHEQVRRAFPSAMGMPRCCSAMEPSAVFSRDRTSGITVPNGVLFWRRYADTISIGRDPHGSERKGSGRRAGLR